MRFQELFLKREKRHGTVLKEFLTQTLVDEDEVTSRCSEFQRMVRVQKQPLHERHLQRKNCRLPMRKDIIEAFWKSYENHVSARYSKLNRAEESDACLKATILSVNKNEFF